MRSINLAPAPEDRPASPTAVVVDLVVPVYNEAASLTRQVRRLHRVLETLPVSWRIVIADNGSTDDTPHLAERLAAELPGVAVLHLAAKGRGRALREAWTRSDAQVVAYTDVDLSTDLTALSPLVASVLSGYAEIAVGSRLLPGSRTTRGPKRELISRTYNRLLRVVLGARFRDAQCGFKAVRRDVAAALVPEVADQGWFFDTELLIRAERHGLRVVELPVEWVDDPDSRVDIVRTAAEDLRGVRRLLRELGPRRPSVPMPRPAPVRVEHREAA
jgi:glycosyltransferase involved in cell wall biosynthesis